MTLPIPKQALTQHLIVLGKTGAGKSSAMRVLVEGLLDAGDPVCILDPKGDWYGIKSSADGKHAGYPLVIFGGEHADVPINAHAGAHLAELVATGNRPCIIDMRGWMTGERTRFFIDFASTLFRFNRGKRHLVVDEVHNFAPKGKILDPDAGKMLHWANRLAAEGRGLGLTLLSASQRPQKVHNDYLTCSETLIAMRVIHKADRDAIKDWIDGCADPATGREVLTILASMKRGEAWVWSPEINFGPKRITFPMFKTYDSFKPQETGTAKLKGWAEVDLQEIKAKLSSVVQEAEANDPKLLRKRIAELERQLREKPAATAGRVEVPVLTDKQIERLERALTRMHEAAEKHGQAMSLLWKDQLEQAGALLNALRSVSPKPVPVPRPQIAAPRAAPSQVTMRQVEGITGPMQRILDAIAWMESIGVTEPEQTAVAFLAGYTVGGGAYNNPRGALRTMGLIDYRGSRLVLTDAGRSVANVPDSALTNDELHRKVMERLPGPEQKILRVLLSVYPDAMGNDDLARAAGYEPGGGAYNNPRGRLRTFGLVDYPERGMVRASDILFPL